MGRDGWFKLYRSMEDWEWYKDSIVKAVFLDLLIRAQWEPGQFRGVDLEPGQLITGRKELAGRLGISEEQVRRALRVLKNCQQITSKPTNKFSVITVVNWAVYQSDEKKTTNKRTDKKPHERNKEDKNILNSQSVYMNNYIVQNALSQEETDRLTDIYSDLPGLLAEVDAKIRARQRQTEIKKPYAYVVRAAREMDWPTVEEAEKKNAQRKKHEEELEAAAKPEELTPEQKAKAKELRERRRRNG